MISCFEHIKAPKVLKEIDIYEFIETIKNPDSRTLKSIEETRKLYHKDKDAYNNLKASLPCFAFNFTFKQKRRNNDIVKPTGLIYLDIDNNTNIDLANPLVFVSWLSISKHGRGILVRAENLTKDNFKDQYIAISKELNIEVDIYAAKPTQPTIQSYDEDIYFNENANTWVCDKEPILDFTPNTIVLKKEKKGTNVIGENYKLRFDNYDETNFNGKKHLYFKDEKILKAKVIIPWKIYRGSRNSILSSICYQIRALNPQINKPHLTAIMESINNYHCVKPINNTELNTIINRVIKLENIEPMKNSPRRFLFNHKFNLTRKEKMKIVNQKLGQAKIEKTISEIKKHIDNWDIVKQGNITQRALKIATGKNKKTIEKYYKLFQTEITDIKQQFKKYKSAYYTMPN